MTEEDSSIINLQFENKGEFNSYKNPFIVPQVSEGGTRTLNLTCTIHY